MHRRLLLLLLVLLATVEQALTANNQHLFLQDHFTSSPPNISLRKMKYTFRTINGFFHQSDETTDATTFDYATHSFGLINRAYDTDQDFDPHHRRSQWERFTHYLNHLRSTSPSDTNYKVLYLGRHGQGDHNVAEAFYGTEAWDDYWSKLEGAKMDGENMTIWADAHLTPTGIAQARAVNAFWKQALVKEKIAAPQRYYTSPLHRCLATAYYTFHDLELPEAQPFVPVVKELLRETNGEHTCDRRSTRSYIHSEFPSYEIEAGFSEDDLLWTPDERETNAAQVDRLHELLEDLFENDEESAFLSLSSHSGSIAAILKAVGHRAFALPTGGVIAVFVEGKRRSGGAEDDAASAQL